MGLSVAMLAAGCGDVETAFSDEPVASQDSKVSIGLDGQEFEGQYEIDAQRRLRRLAADRAEFGALLEGVYGSSYDRAAAEDIRAQIVAGDFSWMPVTQLVPAELIPGAAAAYAESQNRIYLNASLVNSPLRAFAYLEEVGHSLDSVLKSEDTPGDEGEAFLRHVLHLPASQSDSTA